MIAIVAVAIAIQIVPPAQPGQTTPPSQGAAAVDAAPATFRGRVVTPDGRPLTGAHLRLARMDSPQRPRNQSTDDDGTFEFTDLRPGQYSLVADRSGYASSNPLTIAFSPGEVKERTDVMLRPLSAIVGRIVDDNGDPVEGAIISAMRLRAGTGRRFVSTGSQRRTNELGRYRVYNLQPGDYVVSATFGSVGGGPQTMVPGYATTYFPGTMSAKEAQIVHVNASEDVPSIDFALIAVKTASVFGQMIGADGQPFQGGIQLAPSRRAGSVGGGSVGAITFRDGRFQFPNVAPGDYVIESTHNNEHGFAWVSVNGADVRNVIVQTQPGSSMTGRFVFEGSSALPGRMSLVSVPIDPDVGTGGQAAAAVRGDVFQLGPLWGTRRFRFGSSPGWALKAILINGQDVTDTPLTFGSSAQSLKDVEIVLTDQVTSLTGTVAVTVANGTPIVFVFSDDRERWYDGSRYVTARAASAGAFSISGLPAGGYLIAAIDKLPEGADQSQLASDPEFLDRLSREATHVTLSERAVATATLRAASLP